LVITKLTRAEAIIQENESTLPVLMAEFGMLKDARGLILSNHLTAHFLDG